MSIVRWRPARDLLNIRDEMDHVFNDFFGTIPERFASGLENVWSPSVDIAETENEFVVTAELPGLSKDDVKISIQDNILYIKGEKKKQKEYENESYHRIERNYGSFQRAFTLSAAVDANQVKASFKDGVLTVIVPKNEETKLKEIPISVE